MRRTFRALLVALAVTAPLLSAASAADKIRVVATIPDLKALTDEVGGNLVEVESLARGTQNAHEMEVRPELHAQAPARRRCWSRTASIWIRGSTSPCRAPITRGSCAARRAASTCRAASR